MRSASARTSGVKSTTSASCMPCRSKGGGLVGKGWVPEAVVDGLEVPAALAGLAVDGDQALREEVAAAAVPAVPVVGRRARRQVGEAEFLVGAHQAPDVGAAGDPPGLVLLGVGPELALRGDGVEGPELPGCWSSERTGVPSSA